jgi:hypothetical protein
MSICRTCEFSRPVIKNNKTPGLEFECYAEMPMSALEIVMGVKDCSGYQEKSMIKEVSIESFDEFPEINPTSLTICASLQTYILDLDIENMINSSSLRWIDMMCNQGKALKEFMDSGREYQYVIGVEPEGDRRAEFEYHRIYIGNPATVNVKPKPNLITSRYGFYYADLESKMEYLKSWYRLLALKGKIVIYPYHTKTSHDIELLDKFIDETFNNIERRKLKKDLVRLTIVKEN